MAAQEVKVYGIEGCGNCRRAKEDLDRFGVSFEWINVAEDEKAAQTAAEISGQKHMPVIVYSDDSFQVAPSTTELQEKLESLGIEIAK